MWRLISTTIWGCFVDVYLLKFEKIMNIGSGSVLSSTGSWKSGDVVPDQFPVGLRVLVVDDDPTCLKILEKMLKNCHYEGIKIKFDLFIRNDSRSLFLCYFSEI